MMIKLKKINHLKAKTWRKVAVLLVVYQCYSNSQRNPELSYYVIPKDSKFKKRLLAMINRKDFTTTASHKVFSLYLAGGKKNYLNNVPTIVPKTLKPIKRTPRRILNSKGVLRRLLPNVQIPDDLKNFLKLKLSLV